ncbi:MAG: FlgD immunoglobulin-like domain containing protein [bacterium]
MSRLPGRVRVTLHDLTGRRVRTLCDAVLGAGRHEIHWDGRDWDGARAAAGVYLVKVTTERATSSGRSVPLR